jgi:cytochrome P450
LGFSAGARGCIGKHLAYLESKIALVKLMRRYKTIEVPKQITMKVGLVYEAEHFDAIYSK